MTKFRCFREMAMSELRFRELIDGLNSLGRKLSMGRVNEPVEFAPGEVSDLIDLISCARSKTFCGRKSSLCRRGPELDWGDDVAQLQQGELVARSDQHWT